MRLSGYARTTVRPTDFRTAVAVVLALLGGMGVCYMRTGHVPTVGRWLWGGMLLLVWGAALSQMLRYGLRAMPWQRAVWLTGYTLFAGGHLWPHAPAVTWAEGTGAVMFTAVILLPFLEFGRPRGGTPGEGQSHSAV